MRRLFFLLSLLLPGAAFPQVSLVPFATGWARITEVRNAGDERLFVVDSYGRIKIIRDNGIPDSGFFLDISPKVNSANGEQGLLGLAFSPSYAADGRFYVNYTGAGGATFISRFQVSASDPDSADPAGEEVLLHVDQPFPNHNGGSLHFGPDGYLYCSLGDGGNGGDPGNRAQNPKDTLGKILRIDVSPGMGFAVPPSNPFYGDTAALDLVWARGLRNPWKITFDRLTGDLWIADVGQAMREEINVEPAGTKGGINYGWRCYEGSLPYDTTGCPPAGLTFPVYEYPHAGPVSGCSVTGGYVYRGVRYKAMAGRYFFTDYCTGEIRSLRDSAGTWIPAFEAVMALQGFGSFGEDVYGELYVAGVNSGNIFRLESVDCTPVAEIEGPAAVDGCDPPAALVARYNPALAYRWKRNGVPVAGATDYRLTAPAEGTYTVVVTNDTCTAESEPVVVAPCATMPGDIAVYPNPAQQWATLEIHHDGTFASARVSVYAASGARCLLSDVAMIHARADRFPLDLRTLAAGVYTVRVETGDAVLTGRFAVVRPDR